MPDPSPALQRRFAKAGTPMAALEQGCIAWANPSFELMFPGTVGQPLDVAIDALPPSFLTKALAKTGPRVHRLERKKGPRTLVHDVEVISVEGAVGVVVRDETRVTERELIVGTFGKKLEKVNRKLEARNEVMRTLLDHADDGFFGLDAHGRVLPEMAAILPELIGHDPRGETLAEMLPGENGAAVAQLLGLALEGTIPEALLRESLEYDWTIGERVLRLDLSLLSDAGEDGPARVLGKLSDVTAERREEEARQSQAEYQALVTAAVHHPEHFETARAEVRAFADRLRSESSDIIDEHARQQLLVSVHTVKATTRAYEMSSTTTRLHDLEARLATGDVSVRDVVVRTVVALEEQFMQVGRLLEGQRGAETAKVERRGLNALADQVSRLEGGGRLAQGLRALLLQPLAAELGGLESAVCGTAADRGKVARVELDVGRLRVDRERLRALLSTVPHLARNAVAHGIEDPDARMDAGKHAEGCVRFGAALDSKDASLRLWIEDDGAGVDRERLAAQLEARGLSMPLHDDDEVLAALCVPEVSTAEQADMHAGRGVGMSAVAAEVEKLGGRLSLQTTPGQGTRFMIHLPVDRADPIAVSEFPALSDAA